jgi:hypothetical protein
MAEDQCVDQKHALRQFDDSSFCAKHTTPHKCAAAGPPCFFQTGAERVMRSLHDSFVEALRTELLSLRQSALENLHSWDHAAEWRSRKAYEGYLRDNKDALEAYDRVVFDVQAEHSPQVREFLSLYLPPPDNSLRVDLYQKGQLNADKYGNWLSRTRDFPALSLPPAENEQESTEWYPKFVANWTVFQKGLVPDGPRAGTRAELRHLELVNSTCETSGKGGWIAFQAHWGIESHGLDLGDEDLCCVHVLAQDCDEIRQSWNRDGRKMGRYLLAWYQNSADVYAWSKEWQDRQSRSAAELMEFTKSAYTTAGYPVPKAPFEKWWDETWFKANDERWAFPGTTA